MLDGKHTDRNLILIAVIPLQRAFLWVQRVDIGESEQDQEADTAEIDNVGGDQETNVEVIGESEQEQEAEEGEIIRPCSKEKSKRVATSDVGQSATTSSNGVVDIVDASEQPPLFPSLVLLPVKFGAPGALKVNALHPLGPRMGQLI
ncbi:hypothetical protein L1887_34984 [Cichorium endivia]|nr:hypothetical protein L1887_34984 [Cichorium endivia]